MSGTRATSARRGTDGRRAHGAQVEEVRNITLAVSRRVCPEPQTVLQLAEKSKGVPRALRVGDVGIDGLLRGGVNAGAITEIVGQAGMGKTQLCLTLAVTAALAESCGGAGGRALYIDTESRFSTMRMLEIAATKYPGAFGSQAQADALARNVLVSRPRTCAEMMKDLTNLQSFIIEHGIKCVPRGAPPRALAPRRVWRRRSG